MQRNDLVIGKVKPHRAVQELRGLLELEVEILGAKLQQLTASAVAGQRQRRLPSTSQHEMERGRQMVEQKRQCLMDGCLFDEMVIVEDKHRVAGEVIGDVDEGR